MKILLKDGNIKILSDFNITRDTLKRLFGFENQYISGETIDYCSTFLGRHMNQKLLAEKKHRHIHVFSIHFYKKLKISLLQ